MHKEPTGPYSDFAYMLREYRNAKGLYQYEIAELADMRSGRIVNYEAGMALPEITNWHRVAKAYGIGEEKFLSKYKNLVYDKRKTNNSFLNYMLLIRIYTGMSAEELENKACWICTSIRKHCVSKVQMDRLNELFDTPSSYIEMLDDDGTRFTYDCIDAAAYKAYKYYKSNKTSESIQ